MTRDDGRGWHRNPPVESQRGPYRADDGLRELRRRDRERRLQHEPSLRVDREQRGRRPAQRVRGSRVSRRFTDGASDSGAQFRRRAPNRGCASAMVGKPRRADGPRGPRRVRPLAGRAADSGVRGGLARGLDAGLLPDCLEHSVRRRSPVEKSMDTPSARARRLGGETLRGNGTAVLRDLERNERRGSAPGGRPLLVPTGGDRRADGTSGGAARPGASSSMPRFLWRNSIPPRAASARRRATS